MKLASVAVMVLIVTVTQWTIVTDIFYVYLKDVYICKYEQKSSYNSRSCTTPHVNRPGLPFYMVCVWVCAFVRMCVC